ncbi:MAG: hypothetical protein Q7U05_06815 [Polaromonas sp.]|nr:hypothetical protein [Polaromonas sp.]
MNNDKKAEAFDSLVESYLAMGFGVLPKREIDLLIFKNLMEMNDYKGKSNYELAELLRIPDSRIKTLKLNSALRHKTVNSKNILANIVARLIKSEQYADFQGGKFEVSLEDPLERRELENFLKKRGHHAEYMLNSEVLRIFPIRLFEVIMDNVENAEGEIDMIIRTAIDNNAAADDLLEGAEKISQKIAKLRKAILTPDTLKSLIGLGFTLMTGLV